MNSTLTPRFTFDELYPPRTVFTMRSSPSLMRWAIAEDEFRLDSATGMPISIMGEMPLISHENVSTPAAIEFFRFAGLNPARNIIRYSTEDEAVSRALDAARRGYRIAYAYPPLSPLDKSDALLFPVSLYNWLNDKKNLGRLVDGNYLPEGVVLPTDRLNEIMDFTPDEPVFVKACHAGASGGGRDVRYCPDYESRIVTAEWIKQNVSDISAIRVEKEEKTGTSWCVNLAALDAEVIYLGSASQLFESPAHQTGNRIDPSDMPPDSVVDLAVKTLESAADMGYRGVVGFDIAYRESGEPVVFDLNFRIAASTKMILLYDTIVEKIGGGITESWGVTVEGALSPAIERIRKFAQSGQLVPLRLYEATPLSNNRSVISGIIAGNTIEEIESIRNELTSALEGLIED